MLSVVEKDAISSVDLHFTPSYASREFFDINLGYVDLYGIPLQPQRFRHMTSFEDREKGFERKFAHDQELQFKATARRNKLLGLWAADLMGLSGGEAEDYAKLVIKADFEEPGDEDVFRKIRKDFDEKGVQQSDHQIRRTMDDLMHEAVRQIEGEKS